ncbi:hypothetical protein ACKZJ7_04545 [Leptospira sp. 'Mane']
MLILSKTNDSYFKFYLEEPQSLKGVLKNKPYPIIWIKNESANDTKLNLLLNDSLFSELPKWYEEEYNRIKQILFSS